MSIRNPALFLLLLGVCLAFYATAAIAETQRAPNTAEPTTESHVIQSFAPKEDDESGVIKIDDQRKRQVMFAMGVPLLLFIITTVVLGIAMGVFGKEVYVAHMIFAGLSLTLALGHAIVGLVWFWPF